MIDIPEPELDEQQVRAGYPELTRCVHCGALDDQTIRNIFRTEDEKEEFLLTVWLHPACAEQWKPPVLEYEFTHYRVPYRPFVPLPPRGPRTHRMKSWPRSPRWYAHCYTCEAFERPDHKFNRLGYEPMQGWSKPRMPKMPKGQETLPRELSKPPRCVQCNGTPDGTELEVDGVWLHPECVRFYKKAERRNHDDRTSNAAT